MAGYFKIEQSLFEMITDEVCGTPHIYDTLLNVADAFADTFFRSYDNGSNYDDLQEVKNTFLIRVYKEVFHSFYGDGEDTDKRPDELEKWLARRATWVFNSHYQKQKKLYDNLSFTIDEQPEDDELPRLTPPELTSGSPEDALVAQQNEIENTERNREQVKRLIVAMLTSPSEPYIILSCLAVDLYFATHTECQSKKDAENAIVQLDYTLDELADFDFGFLRGFTWLDGIDQLEELILQKLDRLQDNGVRLGESRLSDFFGKADGVTALSKWTYVQGKSLQRKLGLTAGGGK